VSLRETSISIGSSSKSEVPDPRVELTFCIGGSGADDAGRTTPPTIRKWGRLGCGVLEYGSSTENSRKLVSKGRDDIEGGAQNLCLIEQDSVQLTAVGCCQRKTGGTMAGGKRSISPPEVKTCAAEGGERCVVDGLERDGRTNVKE
jgi:hypothetical protein